LNNQQLPLFNKTDAEFIHAMEKKAMTGDRRAVLELVSLGRVLRDAMDELWKNRYRDGCPDQIVAINVESQIRQYLDDRFYPRDNDDD
jgi:hypothetical protein